MSCSGACGARATRGPRQRSAQHSVCCVSTPAFLWVLSNMERAKRSELQQSFSSQLGDEQEKRSDNFSNISMILCPTCWAHLHIDVTDGCHQCPFTICATSESYCGSGETAGFFLMWTWSSKQPQPWQMLKAGSSWTAILILHRFWYLWCFWLEAVPARHLNLWFEAVI